MTTSVDPSLAALPTRRRVPRPGPLLVARALLLIAILLIWQLWASSSTDGLVPSVTEVLDALVSETRDGTLGSAFLASNAALLLGLAIALLAGILLGIAVARIRWLDLALAPYVDLALVIPMVAMVPVVVVFLGIGLEARVAVVVLFALPDVIVVVRGGVRAVDRTLIEMARSYGAREGRLWSALLLPAVFPSIMTAVRVAIGRGLMGMVVVELTLVASGLGGLMVERLGAFQPASMFAVVVVLAAEALLLGALATRGERLVARRMGFGG